MKCPNRVSPLSALLCSGFLCALGAAPAANATLETYTVDKAHAKVFFIAYTKLFDTEGRFSSWKATAQLDPDNWAASSFRVSVDVATVDTDNGKRDDHLRKKDFFWVDKFPKATFVSKALTPTGEGKANVSGTLTIRGIAKEVTIPMNIVTFEKRGRKVIRFRGTAKINRHDFNVSYRPGVLLPSIKDIVDLTVDINFLGPKPKQP